MPGSTKRTYPLTVDVLSSNPFSQSSTLGLPVSAVWSSITITDAELGVPWLSRSLPTPGSATDVVVLNVYFGIAAEASLAAVTAEAAAAAASVSAADICEDVGPFV